MSPAQVWDHGHTVTEYQLWTRYCHATGQLNFWCQNHPPDGSCTYRECVRQKETKEHLFWGCFRAQASWARLVSHWESTPQQPHRLLGWLEHCANHNVPRLSPKVTAMLLPDTQRISIDSPQPGGRYKRSQGPSSSRCFDNRVDSVFHDANIPMQASEALIWRMVQLQLRALIKRRHCRADTAVRGAQLAACFDIVI